MDTILAIPLAIRLALLFIVGAAAGGWINLAAYTLAWNRRSISPWSAPPAGAARRTWADRVPIFGWRRLARESALHGHGFWIRPLVVELLAGLLFAGLYAWEIRDAARWLIPAGAAPAQEFLSANLPLVAYVRYLGHLVLVGLMLAASLIDIDEKTIPDAITVSGTLFGLALVAIYPWALLPAGEWLIGEVPQVEFLTLVSPEFWNGGLNGLPLTSGLAIAIGCWTLWCGGLLPRRLNTRRGLRTAVRVFVHRLRVDATTYPIAALWLLGAVAIVLAAWKAPQAHWAGLMTTLVGMAASGGIIWAVRVIGSAALGREAMGFGDVTLMAMIGTLVGWQGAMVVFFLAPFFGLAIGLTQWILHGEHEVPFGPFLCMAALVVLVDWNDIWHEISGTFALGWIVPVLLGGCVAAMGLLLAVYRLARWGLGRTR